MGKSTIVVVALMTALSLSPATGNLEQFPFLKKDWECLITNVYQEARGEPFIGQVAVAKVTLNRASNQLKTLCSVVYEKFQFSWTIGKKSQILDAEAYKTAERAAYLALSYSFPATHFHAVSVRPEWSKKLTHLTTINNHMFYY